MIATELDRAQRESSPAQAKLLERQVTALSTDLPPLPDFSDFHDRFRPFPDSPEGDIRSAFFLAYDPANNDYVPLDEARQQVARRPGARLHDPRRALPARLPGAGPRPGHQRPILEFLTHLDVSEIHGYEPDLGLSVFTEAALAT